MYQKTVPELYLSTSEKQWRVIYQGMPLCADTTQENAVKIYEKTIRQLRIQLPANYPVWDGDIGQFR